MSVTHTCSSLLWVGHLLKDFGCSLIGTLVHYLDTGIVEYSFNFFLILKYCNSSENHTKIPVMFLDSLSPCAAPSELLGAAVLPLIAQVNTEITSLSAWQAAFKLVHCFFFPLCSFFFFFFAWVGYFFPLTGIFCKAFTANFHLLLADIVSQALLELSRIVLVFSVII